MEYKDQEFQDFLNEHKALSQSELEGLDFPRLKFKKPQSPGVYAGTLVAKEWGRNMSIISYFEIGEDLIDLVKFTTYRNSRGNYMSLKGEISLENAQIGEIYTLFLRCTKNKVFLEKISNKNILNVFVDECIKLF